MNTTPKGNRIHIGLFGKRNVGKSSFLNKFTDQMISIVSSVAGTTTDPVEKAYELHGLGAMLLIDTAGLDDVGDLGALRIQKTNDIIKRCDAIFILIENEKLDSVEKNLVKLAIKKNAPYFLIVNKSDQIKQDKRESIKQKINIFFQIQTEQQNKNIFFSSSITGEGIDEIKDKIRDLFIDKKDRLLINDLISDKDVVVLVMPQDKEAPVKRLILPQSQVIRELLDDKKISINTTVEKLPYVIEEVLKTDPKLVVTDSQAFNEVSKLVPERINLTSFSILFARQKGDLAEYIKGVKKIDDLEDNDKILILESCSHHAIKNDIGRDKIPNWLKKSTKKDLKFEIIAGKDFPKDLNEYKLIIQCGGCMVNRSLIMSHIDKATASNIGITNYGVIIAYIHQILNRAIKVFELDF